VPFPTVDKIVDDVIASIEKTLRIHPCLRFSQGQSGAGWVSMHTAKRLANSWAGVVCIVHSGADVIVPKGILVAFLAGVKDDVHPIEAVRQAYAKHKANPARMIEYPDGGHGIYPLEDIKAMYNWMLLHQRLNHPKIPSKERKAFAEELKARMEGAAAIEDLNARLAEIEFLLAVPDADKWKQTKDLQGLWFTTSVALAHASEDVRQKHNRLTALLEHERAKAAKSNERSEVAKELKEMRQEGPAKDEYEAYKEYTDICKDEEKAGSNLKKKQSVAKKYAKLAAALPDTEYGKKAAEEAKRLGE